MLASTEVLDALKSIGLNLYERRIFVALLAKGVATAAEVSEIAKVPRSRSYDVLESLAEKGFVVAQPSKPLKYVALEPKDALEKTKHNLERGHNEIVERIDRLAKSSIISELSRIHRGGLNLVQPYEMTGTLKGRDRIHGQLRSIFRSAKREINIITTKEGLDDLYQNQFRILKKVAKRGVRLRIVVPSGTDNAARAFSEIADVRRVAGPAGRFATIDGEHVVMALTDDKKVHETQDVAFWANSSHAAEHLGRHFFDRVWTASSELKIK